MLQEIICLAFVFAIMAWEADRFKPRPYSLGNGDTLMVRTRGYGFCPKHCDVKHFHVGHKKGYECEDITCNHIIYEERLN